MVDRAALAEEIVRLGPWHVEVEVTPGVSTRAWADVVGETITAPREPFQALMNSIYPGGLQGRSILDCGCNAGGYLFWCKELGAGQCFGFDAREHWIEQARFLLRHRGEPDIHFEVSDLYSLPELEPFDITIFSGLFYHLPDPITGLKIAADLTKELIIVVTATKSGEPDGRLYMELESTESPLSGIYGLNWRPTGPNVMHRILRSLGFPEVRVLWVKEQAKGAPADHGWMGIAASRTPGLLDDVATGWPPRKNARS
jgi:tRNA (mo5U34)-methyltransferase